MKIVVPIRQMKDIDQHVSWNNGPVFRDLKQKKKGRGHWKKILRAALLGFSSNLSSVEQILFSLKS